MGDENVTESVDRVEPERVSTEKRAYDRSTIEFPYSDLDNAIEVARTIHTRAGSACSPNQLAAWMDKSATGGTFRAWLSAARIFGFVETERGQVSLSALGQEATQPDTQQGAKIGAFLNVPLYQEMFDRYEGHALPPAAAIERQMVELGVVKKQADRARQTFMKSAQAAGFVDPQTGRFVKPGMPSRTSKEAESNKEHEGSRGGGDGGDSFPPDIDPIIAGLLQRLPKTGSVWPEAERKRWLDLLSGCFWLIYESGDTPNESADTERE